MYNRSSFNRSSFNRITGNQQMAGSCRLQLAPLGRIRRMMSPAGEGKLQLAAEAAISRLPVFTASPVKLQLAATAQASRHYFPVGRTTELWLVAEAPGYNAYGLEFIRMPELVLKPGQELIIDTEDMTVTLDGVNAAHLVTIDSDFIQIAPGENILVYEDGILNRSVQIKIEWKPRWL